MRTRIGFLSAVLAAAAISSAPPALAARTQADAFVRQAIQGNLAEIKEGRLAERKGATEGVRKLGAVLVRDHAKANQKAMTAASSMGVMPPAEPAAKQQMEYRHLASLSGSRFDRAFVASQVKDHKKTISKYEKEAHSTNSPASSYAEASLPVLHEHLRLAQALVRQPGG